MFFLQIASPPERPPAVIVLLLLCCLLCPLNHRRRAFAPPRSFIWEWWPAAAGAPTTKGCVEIVLQWAALWAVILSDFGVNIDVGVNFLAGGGGSAWSPLPTYGYSQWSFSQWPNALENRPAIPFIRRQIWSILEWHNEPLTRIHGRLACLSELILQGIKNTKFRGFCEGNSRLFLQKIPKLVRFAENYPNFHTI